MDVNALFRIPQDSEVSSSLSVSVTNSKVIQRSLTASGVEDLAFFSFSAAALTTSVNLVNVSISHTTVNIRPAVGSRWYLVSTVLLDSLLGPSATALIAMTNVSTPNNAGGFFSSPAVLNSLVNSPFHLHLVLRECQMLINVESFANITTQAAGQSEIIFVDSFLSSSTSDTPGDRLLTPHPLIFSQKVDKPYSLMISNSYIAGWNLVNANTEVFDAFPQRATEKTSSIVNCLVSVSSPRESLRILDKSILQILLLEAFIAAPPSGAAVTFSSNSIITISPDSRLVFSSEISATSYYYIEGDVKIAKNAPGSCYWDAYSVKMAENAKLTTSCNLDLTKGLDGHNSSQIVGAPNGFDSILPSLDLGYEGTYNGAFVLENFENLTVHMPSINPNQTPTKVIAAPTNGFLNITGVPIEAYKGRLADEFSGADPERHLPSLYGYGTLNRKVPST